MIFYLINSYMKVHDILNESVTDIVARLYKEASEGFDQHYNKEDADYKTKNKKYYNEYFKEWFKEDIVPVFTKPVDKPQHEYTTDPKPGKLQTPGFRGLNYALAAAGLPYDHSVQGYENNASRIVASQTMDAARGNNAN